MPGAYRRAILLLSETNDRGSRHTVEDTVRAVTAANTVIYSLGFFGPYHDASEYGHKQLPTKAGPRKPPDISHTELSTPASSEMSKNFEINLLQGILFGFSLSNPIPNPPGGCMGKDSGSSENQLSRAYNCLVQLAPPMGLARLTMIAATEGMRKNIPQAVARLTGGEYFEFNNAKSLEDDLAKLANHIPNRYILSFQPQSPHPGFHAISLTAPNYEGLKVSARAGYWIDDSAGPSAPTQ